MSPLVGVSGVDSGCGSFSAMVLRTGMEMEVDGEEMSTNFVAGGMSRVKVIEEAVVCFCRDDSLSLSVPEQLADGLRRREKR